MYGVRRSAGELAGDPALAAAGEHAAPVHSTRAPRTARLLRRPARLLRRCADATARLGSHERDFADFLSRLSRRLSVALEIGCAGFLGGAVGSVGVVVGVGVVVVVVVGIVFAADMRLIAHPRRRGLGRPRQR